MAAPKRLLWDSDEYYRLADMGLFQGRRVELIGGEILEMPAQKNFHAVGISLTEDALRAAFGPAYWVRVQMSLDLSPRSVPDPDLAVVPGTPRQHAAAAGNPTTALLIVEVSDTTLVYDRRRKASLYAASGIEDYWIVNLVDRQLEVHRRPVADPAQPFGFAYADVQVLDVADRVTPLAAGQATIVVADLLP
ncbi:MAG TPA: Uma2 family endonuclease [Gemmataceae bacterium]|nr:Uma2 family endonuclease [Gemmataceae bacterium]